MAKSRLFGRKQPAELLGRRAAEILLRGLSLFLGKGCESASAFARRRWPQSKCTHQNKSSTTRETIPTWFPSGSPRRGHNCQATVAQSYDALRRACSRRMQRLRQALVAQVAASAGTSPTESGDSWRRLVADQLALAPGRARRKRRALPEHSAGTSAAKLTRRTLPLVQLERLSRISTKCARETTSHN